MEDYNPFCDLNFFSKMCTTLRDNAVTMLVLGKGLIFK